MTAPPDDWRSPVKVTEKIRKRLRAWKQERERPTLTPRMRLSEIDQVIRELEAELKRYESAQD